VDEEGIHDMLETSDRVDQFKDEVAQLRLRGKGAAQRERVLLVVSVVMMIAGIALAIGAYSAAQNVKVTPGSNLDVLNSNAYMPLAISGLTISVVGGFLFLRYSLANFFRYWLLRQSYEQRAAIDEVSTRTPSA
jgi:hypothetical protein